MAKDPVIPDVPTSIPADQVPFFRGIKAAAEFLMGQTRNTDYDRAVRVRDFEKLGIDLSTFLKGSSLNPKYQVSTTPSGKAPDPPENLVVAQGIFAHILTWDNPLDKKVWYIEIWVAEGSQSRDDAVLEGVYTVLDDKRGEQGLYRHSGFSVTKDQTYWIRSKSYGYKPSPWCPPDAQGGYVVPGAESTTEAINRVLEVLNGSGGIKQNALYQDLVTEIEKIAVHETAIQEEQTARQGADDALAQSIGLVSAAVGENTSAIQEEATARADGDSANAQQISTVQTTVGQHTTSIQEHSESIDGIKGKYVLKIDANGHIAGWELINDGTTAGLVFLSDKIKFIMPDGQGQPVAIISTGLVDGEPSIGFDGNAVFDGTVLARAIQLGQLTAEHFVAAQEFIGHIFRSANYTESGGIPTAGYKAGNDGILRAMNAIISGSIIVGPGSNVAAGATNDLSLVARGSCEVSGNTVSKESGLNNWDSDCYSVESHLGGAYVSFVAETSNKNMMVGLNSDPLTNQSYASIDYALYLRSGSTLRVYQSGVNKGDVGTYAVGDFFTIVYNGATVKIYKNGTQIYSTSASNNLKLYADSSFNSVGGKISNVRFGPVTNRADIDSTAQSKADTAKSQAISTAATDATSKANTAKSDAISAAATDAQTKVNNRLSSTEKNYLNAGKLPSGSYNNAGNISETSGRKWAGESGANVTGNHTAADTAKVGGTAASTIRTQAAAGATFTSGMAGALAYLENITNTYLTDNCVEARNINVLYLSALAASLGTITAGVAKSADGKIILDLNNKQLRIYDDSGTLRVKIGKL